MGGAKKNDDRLTFAQTFISGGIAGVASRSITSPLDVIKILAQVGNKSTEGGFFSSFANLYRQDGLKAFWAGNGIACMRLFPYNAVQFAAFSKLKQIMRNSEGQLTPVRALVAGSLGGIVATIVTYPSDMVKTRLTIKDDVHQYNGVVHCFRDVYKNEGIGAFFSGMLPSIVGVIPFAGGTFMAYEMLEKVWGKPKDKLTPLENFANGCMAAAFAQTFSFPFDTIRKKLQAQRKGGEIRYKGMVDAFAQTWRTGGPTALWAGTTANLLKVAPYAGIMFATFEACRRVLLFANGYTMSPIDATPRPGVPQHLTPEQLKEWKQQEEQ